MMAGVAGRYASALFELAKESDKLTETEADLAKFEQLLAASEDLRRMVRSPVFTAEEQTRAIGRVLDKAGIGGLSANFFKLIASNRRLFVASDIIKAFRELSARSRGEVTAEVASATPLGAAHLAELEKALAASVGKEVKLETRVDPALLGGLVVKIGSRMIDSSLRTKLSGLETALKGAG